MQAILRFAFMLTNNHGVSIIALSIVINIVILPLYYLAENLKESYQMQLDMLKPKIDFLKCNFKGQERHVYLQTLYKIYNYHPVSSIKASLGLLLQIPFFFAAFHLIGNYDTFNGVSFGVIRDLGQSDKLLFGQNILPILMTLISLFSAYYYAKNMNKGDRLQLWGLSVIFLILLYFESAALLLYWTMNNLFSLMKNWIEDKFNTTKFKQLLSYFLLFPIQKIRQNKVVNFAIKDIFTQAVILFFGTIFIYKAIPMIASDMGMYLADYLWVAINLITFFVLSVATSLVVYYFLSKKWRSFLTKLMAFSALSGLFYTFIAPFEIPHLSSLSLPEFWIQYESVIIKMIKLLSIVPLLVIWFFIFKKNKYIIWIVLFSSNTFLMMQALSAGFNPKEIDAIVNHEEMPLDKIGKFYSFSKESNTIVIMLDQFQGNMLADIVKRHPEIKKSLSGFVYYPNTLTHGNFTWLSMGAIAGGEKFQAQLTSKQKGYKEIKRANQHMPYVPKNMAYLNNMAMAEKYHHSYSVFKPNFVKCSIFDIYDDAMCERRVVTDKDLLNKKNKILAALDSDSGFETAKFFSQLSFIMSLPHQVKSTIANYLRKEGGGFHHYSAQIYQYSQLKNMTDFANINSNKKTFKFIENEFTHELWLVNDDCQIVEESFKGYQGAFNVGYCSIRLLNDFFVKLKDLNIYDKTKIIIVSDHGRTIGPRIDTKNFNTSAKHPGVSALMLVKDFNQSGDLKTSMQFLSNMDAYGIALSGVSENREVEFDRIKTLENDRSLIHIRQTDPWYSYNITKAFKVKNDIFNEDNWQELNQNQILKLSQ
jgi:YidC/Oxa1 family membrane protein insertase